MAVESDNEVIIMVEGSAAERNVAQHTDMTDVTIPQYGEPADTKTSQANNTNPFAGLQTAELDVNPINNEEPYGEETHQVDLRAQNNMAPNYEQGEDYQQAPASSEEEKDNFIRKAIACLGSLLVASVVVTAQASQDCVNQTGSCDSWKGWAVSLGVISTILCLYLLLTMTFLLEHRLEKTKKTLPYFAIFLTIWWLLGVATLTFDGPFEETGNGFFASWLALLLSIYFCQITILRVEAVLLSFKDAVSSPYQRAMGMLMVFSFAVAYSCLLLLDDRTVLDDSNATPQELWGLSCGLISGFLIIIFMCLEPRVLCLSTKRGALACLLIPLWLFGAGVLTFDEPFTLTSNGYFCAWGSFCASCYLFYLSQTDRTKRIIRTITTLGTGSIDG